MEKTQICITFAGPYGASKSPVAQHLSCTFGWPRLENDVIRKEAKEDGVDESEYTKRVIDRLVHLVEDGCDFVYDASNDRHWLKFLDNFATAPRAYAIGVISFDLSKEFTLNW